MAQVSAQLNGRFATARTFFAGVNSLDFRSSQAKDSLCEKFDKISAGPAGRARCRTCLLDLPFDARMLRKHWRDFHSTADTSAVENSSRAQTSPVIQTVMQTIIQPETSKELIKRKSNTVTEGRYSAAEERQIVCRANRQKLRKVASTARSENVAANDSREQVKKISSALDRIRNAHAPTSLDFLIHMENDISKERSNQDIRNDKTFVSVTKKRFEPFKGAKKVTRPTTVLQSASESVDLLERFLDDTVRLKRKGISNRCSPRKFTSSVKSPSHKPEPREKPQKISGEMADFIFTHKPDVTSEFVNIDATNYKSGRCAWSTSSHSSDDCCQIEVKQEPVTKDGFSAECQLPEQVVAALEAYSNNGKFPDNRVSSPKSSNSHDGSRTVTVHFTPLYPETNTRAGESSIEEPKHTVEIDDTESRLHIKEECTDPSDLFRLCHHDVPSSTDYCTCTQQPDEPSNEDIHWPFNPLPPPPLPSPGVKTEFQTPPTSPHRDPVEQLSTVSVEGTTEPSLLVEPSSSIAEPVPSRGHSPLVIDESPMTIAELPSVCEVMMEGHLCGSSEDFVVDSLVIMQGEVDDDVQSSNSQSFCDITAQSSDNTFTNRNSVFVAGAA